MDSDIYGFNGELKWDNQHAYVVVNSVVKTGPGGSDYITEKETLNGDLYNFVKDYSASNIFDIVNMVVPDSENKLTGDVCFTTNSQIDPNENGYYFSGDLNEFYMEEKLYKQFYSLYGGRLFDYQIAPTKNMTIDNKIYYGLPDISGMEESLMIKAMAFSQTISQGNAWTCFYKYTGAFHIEQLTRDKIISLYENIRTKLSGALDADLKDTNDQIEKKDEQLKTKQDELRDIDKKLKETDDALQKCTSELEKKKYEKEEIEKQTKELKNEIDKVRSKCEQYERLGFEFNTNENENEEENRKEYSSTYRELIDRIKPNSQSKGKSLDHYSKRVVARFLSAMFTNQIIILSGPSGTGKTTLPQLIAEATKGECKIISVQPSWKDETDLFGYYNSLNKSFEFTEFTDTVIDAGKHPKKPYFLVLDEMNLSRVEYYFAKYLSAMELNGERRKLILYSKKITKSRKKELIYELREVLAEYMPYNDTDFLNRDETSTDENNPFESLEKQSENLRDNKEFKRLRREYNLLNMISNDYPSEIIIPSNLQIVGTINMDETTKDISPKVIDRSYVIEVTNKDTNSEETSGKDYKCEGYKIDKKVEGATDQREDIIKLIAEYINEVNGKKENSSICLKMSNRQKDHIRDMYGKLGGFLTKGSINDFVDDILLSKILPAARNTGELDLVNNIESYDSLKNHMQTNKYSEWDSTKKLVDMFDSRLGIYNYWKS